MASFIANSILSRVFLQRQLKSFPFPNVQTSRPFSSSPSSPITSKPKSPSISACSSVSVTSSQSADKDDSGTVPLPRHDFDIISHDVIFKRYQTVYQRDVRYPDGRQVSYDVIGNPRSNFKSVFIFPFDSRKRTVTVLREYSPGRNLEQLALPAGMFEPEKHDSIETAARAELSEEAYLKLGQLVPLADPVQADKYSLNRFFYFLALDAVPDPNPPPRDPEEWISVLDPIPIAQIEQLVVNGSFNTPHSLCIMLALSKLRQLGHL